jgi:hypothetical protein
MDDLIKALTIFKKYTDSACPTHCEHDELRVMVSPDKVTEEDIKLLEELSFRPENGCFLSYLFGSA